MENEKKKNTSALSDQDLLSEALATEQYMTQQYNTFANTCTTQTVRDEAINILNNEHKMQAELLMECQNQGWFSPKQVEQQQVEQTRMKFEKQKEKLKGLAAF